MRTIVILKTAHINNRLRQEQPKTYLVGHDHNAPITQVLRILVVGVMLQSHDLLNGLDLAIFHDLVVIRLAYVQQFSA